jgi:L,D-transpeptidase ErfK/SrfK
MILMKGCSPSSPIEQMLNELSEEHDSITTVTPNNTVHPLYVVVNKDIKMQNYFAFIDSLANARLDSCITVKEYVLVNANPWIIDTLRSLDYYHQKARGVFVYDQSQLVILHTGDSLLIPDQITAAEIVGKLLTTQIDVNLPEFRLRIIQGRDTVITYTIRIGQNKNTYLDFYQREIDMRTPVGDGEIVTIRKAPKYFDPKTGVEYIETTRDDGNRTKMPIIPSLTPAINGIITGTLIHATTNPKSLGKAYSHGCIGTSEADIWSIYYLTPPGTKIRIRYDLEIKDDQGNIKKLRDIYYREDE